jgi:hypothetical protein
VAGHRTHWLGGLGAIALIVCLGLPTAPPAGAASNGSWSVYPTTLPNTTPRVIFSPQLVPGKNLTDSVTVSNLSASPLAFDLFAADAFNTPGGGLSLHRKVDPVEGLGAWIHLAHSGIIVPAHGSMAVPFVVVVPVNATPGDHVGGIVAEQTTGTPAAQGRVPINVVQAVGVRVYGRVRGPLVSRLGVRPPHLAVNHTTAALFGANTGAVVTVQVANEGNVVLTPFGYLQVTATFGTTTSRRFSVGPLLPGEAVTRYFSVSVRAAGEVTSVVRVTATGAHASASDSQWSVPWGLLGAVLLVLLLVVFTILRLVRGRHRRAEAAAIGKVTDPEDEVAGLA